MWYLRLETRDLESGFSENFLSFLSSRGLWMNSCALCVYVLCAFIFCLLLIPLSKAYTILIFHCLNELLFPSFCKNFHHAVVMKSLNFRRKPAIIARSHIKISERYLNRWKKSDTKRRLKKIVILRIWYKFTSNNQEVLQ